jgi:bifunctional enzyme CysN/CysC
MIIDDAAAAQDLDAAIQAGIDARSHTQVGSRERAEKLGQIGCAVVVRGENARVVAFALERRLYDLGHAATVLAFDDASAEALSLAARACAEAGLVTIVPTALPIAGALEVGSDVPIENILSQLRALGRL